MSKVYQDHFPRTISQYVPSMEFAADVVDGVHIANLGAPATAQADGILDGVTIGTTAKSFPNATVGFDADFATNMGTAGILDAKYGRCLSCTGGASTDQVVTITGRDYLGQVMSEAFTLNGTAIIYGKKAFKFIDTIATTVGTGATALDVGWTDVLGLPYKAEQLIGWSEDGVQKDVGRNVVAASQAMVYATDASLFIASPVNGFITGMSSVSTIANTTQANALTIEIGGTTVAGLALSVLATDSIGDSYTDFAGTDDHGATGKVAKGAGIEIVSGQEGTAGAGVVQAHLEENVRFIDGDATTATTTTGDTRGTVLPYTSCDGSVEYEVRYAVDTSNLHGVAQA